MSFLCKSVYTFGLCSFLCFALLANAQAQAQSKAPAKTAAQPAAKPPLAKPAPLVGPQLKFEKYKLDNGLDVILSEDHRLPLVAANLWYHVRPANQVPGRTR